MVSIKDRLGYMLSGAGNLEYLFSRQVSKRRRIYMLRAFKHRLRKRMMMEKIAVNACFKEQSGVKSQEMLDPIFTAA